MPGLLNTNTINGFIAIIIVVTNIALVLAASPTRHIAACPRISGYEVINQANNVRYLVKTFVTD